VRIEVPCRLEPPGRCSPRRSRAAVARIAGVTFVPAVLRPPPAMDTIDTPWIRLEAVDGHRALAIVGPGTPTRKWVGIAVMVSLLGRDRSPHQNRVVVPARVIYSRSPSGEQAAAALAYCMYWIG